MARRTLCFVDPISNCNRQNGTFAFATAADAGPGAARDQILAFQIEPDVIDVAGMVSGAFTFVGTGAFAEANRIRVIETATGSSIVRFNTNVDLATEAEIRVGGRHRPDCKRFCALTAGST